MSKISSRSMNNGLIKTASPGGFFGAIVNNRVPVVDIARRFDSLVSSNPSGMSRAFAALSTPDRVAVQSALDSHYPGKAAAAITKVRTGIAAAARAAAGTVPVVPPPVTVPVPAVPPPVPSGAPPPIPSGAPPPVAAPVAPVTPTVAPPSAVTGPVTAPRGGGVATPPGVSTIPSVAPSAPGSVPAPGPPSTGPSAAPPAAPSAATPAAAGASRLRAAGTRVMGLLNAGKLKFSLLPTKGKVALVAAVIATIGGAIYLATTSDEEIVAEAEKELDSYDKIMAPVFDYDISNLYGGDLSDITDDDKATIIGKLTAAVGANDTASLSPAGIIGIIASAPSAVSEGGLSEADLKEALSNDEDFAARVGEASSQLIAKAEAAQAASAGGGGGGGGGGATPPISSPRPQRANRSEGYAAASLILKGKGYLASVQSEWTPEFDKAFREFVDAGTAGTKVTTNLVGGQSWSDVAGSLGVTPDKKGAFDIIRTLGGSVPDKGSAPSATTGPTAPPVAPTETKPVAKETEDYPILASIIGAMYNEKLVGTPGFDLVKEPKRIQAIVDSVGGANEAGYGNTARIIAKRNPAILARLPGELNAPVDQAFAKNPANKRLLQAIQVAINGIFDSSMEGSKRLGIFNPALPKATELVSAWLRSPAGGNWKDKVTTEEIKPLASSIDQWIKLASERKMRIRAKIAAEMTPAERAAARRTKMREAV